MKRIALIGSGDFAEQVINTCSETAGLQIVGYFDGNKKVGTMINGYPVLGNDEEVEPAFRKELFDYIFVCIGYNDFELKEKVFNKFVGVIPIISIVHPTAIVNHTSKIVQNVLISEGVIVGKDCILEDNVTIEPGVLVGHNGHIGKHSFIAGRAALAGCVTVGEKCFIGLNCSIRDRITIGNKVTVGIGCCVIKNVEDNDIVVGNPHRSISKKSGGIN